MISWFTKNSVAANILMIAILGLGAISALKIPFEVTPVVSFPVVDINMTLRGGTPSDVETQIVIPIERALENVAGVRGMSSSARRDNGRVRLFLEKHLSESEQKEILQDVTARVDAINTFPTESERPRIQIPSTASWYEVISVVLSGKLSEEELLEGIRSVRNDLTSLPEISFVEIRGDRDQQVTIEVPKDTLRAYNLTLADISQAVRTSSIDLSAGVIKGSNGGVLLRTKAQAYTKEDFDNITIRRANGAELKLGDIAITKDSFEDEDKIVRFNGEPAMICEVLRADGEDALAISQAVKDYVANSQEKFPEGVNLSTWDDDSISLRGRISTLVSNLLQGILLVFIALTLFLRPKVALWVVIGIPISFAGALISMNYFGVTANIMSLFGFIVVLGIVVDDAIVTGESVYSRLRGGMNGLDAAIIGTKEVSVPVTFGVITTIAAFTPLLFLESREGELARQIPLVVIPVLIFSLVESKLILPAHLKHLQPRKNPGFFSRIQKKIADGLEALVRIVYTPLLRFATSFRYATVACFLALAAIIGSYYLHKMHPEFTDHPTVDRYFIFARLEMDSELEFEDTNHAVNRVVEAVNTIKGDFIDPGSGESIIRSVLSSAGGFPTFGRSNPQVGFVLVELTPPSQRTEIVAVNDDVAEAWRAEVGEIQGIKRFSIRTQDAGRSGEETESIEIEILGPNDASREAIANHIVDWLKERDDIQTAWSDHGKLQREINVALRPEGKELRLSEAGVAAQVRSAFFGDQAQRLQRGEDNLRVMIRLPEEERKSLHTLETLRINLPNEGSTELQNVALLNEALTPPAIERIDGQRGTQVYATPLTTDTNLFTIEEALTPELDAIAQQYSDTTWRYDGYLADYDVKLKRMLEAGAILMFTLYALLAIPFKSFTQPFYVMLAVPFGILGAIVGHIIIDLTPSWLSVFGILAMAGVVVNDSLVLVDYVNQKRRAGETFQDAVHQAGVRRFRPIILTSITTFAGLLPIIFEKSIQAQFLIPMATSLGFGILFATFITLILIPCAMLIGEDLSQGLAKIKVWYLRPFQKTTSKQRPPEEPTASQ